MTDKFETVRMMAKRGCAVFPVVGGWQEARSREGGARGEQGSYPHQETLRDAPGG
jgi:hypothetical protein